jgi:dipeptidyl aminopeptidase/acylaminoacyl peptidase
MIPEWAAYDDDLQKPFGKSLAWGSKADRIYFMREEELGEYGLYEWAISTNSVRRILHAADRLRDCVLVATQAICFVEPLATPRKIVSVNLDDGIESTLLDANPEFRHIKLGSAERFDWTFDGDKAAFGTLVKPVGYDSTKRYPLVIISYRASRAFEGGTGAEYPTQVFAANGFVVLAYDYLDPRDLEDKLQGSSDDMIRYFEKAYGPGLPALLPTAQALEAAVDILNKNGLIDESRVGITGFSNGVQVVNYLLIHSDKYAAAITSSANWNPIGWYLRLADPDYKRALTAAGLGAPGSGNERAYGDVSLAKNVNRLHTPLLINSGDEEYLYGLQDLVTLRDAGHPIDMYVFPDEGHVKWHPAHRLAIFERNVDWMNFWLRNVEDQSPAKEDQYKYWHHLRQLQQGIQP